MNFRSPFSVVTRVVLKHEFDPSTEIYKLTHKCKAASREIKAQDKISLHMHIAPHPRDHVPPREMADKLVQSYMQTFGSIYRVLHIPKSLEEYELYWSNPETSSQAHVVAKLLLVMAIGTVFQPRQEAFVLRSSALQWIYVAQTWITTPFDKCRLTIEVIQLQCLLIFARLVHDVDGDLLRLSAASLLQTAMQIGLHIDAEINDFPNISPQEIQLRRNLWAMVLEIVVQMSVDSGGIPLIRASDYDFKSPVNMDDMVFKNNMDEFVSFIQRPDSLLTRLQIAAFVNDFRYYSTTLLAQSRCRGTYFQKKRGAAMGLGAAGSSVGGVVLPIALNELLHTSVGFGWAVRIIGFIVLALLLPASMFIKSRLPPRKSSLFMPSAFKQPEYAILIAVCFFATLAMYPLLFYFPSSGIANGMRTKLAFYLVAILNAASFPVES
uniref:Riboflavin transporter MCH5 n=1 Tax=Talaromyces marneffei PM1 TaxID=1077442 RepID=A0A093VH50_TALMA